ncbi:Single-stranded DNA binding protein [Perigonia lusca single nucleopolyhedrovirus]|uniref:Single-stranded DNA binding protein n=1 Tax=Perigonia lusca single nucleopolyhedrovirus TaxID=1675865 RepID=A0A0M3N120_9ABAC|nr:Single-stranded DNA binding protein [Perigonia lusca single nucleopolyhedrovirus]AKN80623.1 Single-stranded DNA binding protein [Perigonia lusca single nucleopolyhedrovirus]
MSKRTHQEVSDAASADEKTVVSVYNNGSTEISEMEEDDNETSMLPVFTKPIVKKRQRLATCLDEFEFNMLRDNYTAIYCDSPCNQLDVLLKSLRNKLNLYSSQWANVLMNMDAKIVIEQAKPPKVVHQVGYHVRGGKLPFYFFDTVYLKKYSGKFGEFFTARWSNITLHCDLFSKILMRYQSWEEDELMTMQENVVIKVPADKRQFVKMFYEIRQEDNQEVYEKGLIKANKPMLSQMFTVAQFEKMFELLESDGPSEEVQMYMFAVVDGFKEGKVEMEMETVNNKKIKEKKWSLAITPVVFIKADPL